MQDGPDISIVAAMIGDPARANMIMALMSGLALTAAELAEAAGVMASTASGHLAKLEACGLIVGTRQGRNRYFRIANADVAHAVEALVTVAARAGHLRWRPGPRNQAMRRARSCYDHLAGEVAVALFLRWIERGILAWRGESVALSDKGREVLQRRGIDIAALERKRRPLCRTCVDWSERRHHLGGSVGAAVLAHASAQGWARREPGSRAVIFSRQGEDAFVAWYAAATGGRR
jgi:DNA-binding transcriptional ArsR family regulator